VEARDPGAFFFRHRSYTPLPFIVASLIWAQPTVASYFVGLAVVLVGETLRLWSVSHAGAATRTRAVGADRLVSSGPYTLVRNPIYCGNLLIGAGFSIMSWALVPVLPVIFLSFLGLQYWFIIRLEERELDLLFGEQYREYRESVPRFFPRAGSIGEAVQGGGGSLRVALRSERRTFQTLAILSLSYCILGAWRGTF